MTITQLEYFLAAANYGTFSTAAEHCFVTQPSLSQQISNLENELGVVLFIRNSKPILLTEAGLAVLEQAKAAVAAFYRTKEVISEFKGNLSGKLRLGVIPTISPYFMPKFLPEFFKRCPEVELDVRDMFTTDIIEALNNDTIDVAILSGGESIKIQEEELFKDKLYLYVSPQSKLCKHERILIEDIDPQELLLLSEGNCLRNQTLRLCKLKETVKLSYNFANCSLETLMHVVDTTPTVTVIPGMLIEYIPQEKRKQVKPFGRAGGFRKITMAVGRTYVRESLIKAVRESVLSVAEHDASRSLK